MSMFPVITPANAISDLTLLRDNHALSPGQFYVLRQKGGCVDLTVTIDGHLAHLATLDAFTEHTEDYYLAQMIHMITVVRMWTSR